MTAEVATAAPGSPRPKRRKTLIIVAAALLITAGAVWSVVAVSGRGGDESEATGPQIQTSEIVSGTLSGSTQVTGVLSYAEPRTLEAHTGGTLTWLPDPGTTVDFGEALWHVDATPTSLLRGDTPAYRDLREGVTPGADVFALERALAGLGHFPGEPDDVFDWWTTVAILSWQAATGEAETGEIVLGDIVFADAPLRIGEAAVTVGQQLAPGSPVVDVTTATQEVRVQLKLAQQQLAEIGGEVTIDLPGGVTLTGSVTAIGVPTETQGASGDAETVIPVTITLAGGSDTAGLQQASVTVGFPSDSHEDVLSVPVDALIAIDAQTFGVELVHADGSTERVPVDTGVFVSGRVEISGPELAAGMDVAVPTV